MENLFSDVEVYWISRFDYERNWYLKQHTHTFYQLIYIVNGSCQLQLNGEDIYISAPQIIFLSPGESHGFSEIYTDNLVTLDVKFMINNSNLVEICSNISPLTKPITEEIKQILEQIRFQGIRKNRWYQEFCRLNVSNLLLILESWYSKETESPIQSIPSLQLSSCSINPLTNKIIRYLECNLSFGITSSDLEQVFSFSYRYLSVKFKRDMGMTPMSYRERLRIERAKELMSYTTYELKEIFEMIGFSDIHQFTKSFKKIEGIPPGHWRNNLHKQIRQDILIHPGFVNKLQIGTE